MQAMQLLFSALAGAAVAGFIAQADAQVLKPRSIGSGLSMPAAAPVTSSRLWLAGARGRHASERRHVDHVRPRANYFGAARNEAGGCEWIEALWSLS